MEERVVLLRQRRRPVVACCQVEREPLVVSQLSRSESRVHGATVSVVESRCELVTGVEYPVVFLEHVLHRCRELLELQIHYVSTSSVAQTPFLCELVVAHKKELYVLLEVVLLGTCHAVVDELAFPSCAVGRDSAVAKREVGGLKTCTIVVERVLGVELQPVSDVHISSIVAECTPTLVAVLEAVTSIVRVRVMLIGTEPVAVQLIGRCIVLPQVAQRDVARHEEQLSHLAIQTGVRTVLCLGVRHRNLAVEREPLVHSSTGIEIDVYLVERLVLEQAVVAVVAYREAEVRLL